MSAEVEKFLEADPVARSGVARDRWKRPLIETPGGEIKGYTRASTLGKALDEGSGLAKWMAKQAVIGAASRKDLVLAVNAHRDDDEKLKELIEQAMEAAGSSSAATTGTALHSFCDQFDRGLEPYVPEEYAADVDAYLDATAAFEVVSAEEFAVCDEVECGGTPDRIDRLLGPLPLPNGETLPPGSLVVVDIKTGKTLDFGHLTYSVQLAVYARSKRYDISAGRTRVHWREEIPVGDRLPWVEGEEVNTDWGVIIHLPSGKGQATLHPVDLTAGWELAKLAVDVREWRKRKNIIGGAVRLQVVHEDFFATAEAAESLAELFDAHERALAAGQWGAALKAAFKARKAGLEEAAA